MEFARVSLQLHSIAVPQCIMEKVHPSHFLSLNRARQDLETAFDQHFHNLGCLGLIILLHRSSMASNTSWINLKGKAYDSLVGKKSFHVSCTSVWLPTLSVLLPENPSAARYPPLKVDSK